MPDFNFAFARYKLIENLKLKTENYFVKGEKNLKIIPKYFFVLAFTEKENSFSVNGEGLLGYNIKIIGREIALYFFSVFFQILHCRF